MDLVWRLEEPEEVLVVELVPPYFYLFCGAFDGLAREPTLLAVSPCAFFS